MTRGRLHVPGVHQQWRSPGGVEPAGGKIYTDFPEEAVARLRAANDTPSAQPPWRKGKAMKPKKVEKTEADELGGLPVPEGFMEAIENVTWPIAIPSRPLSKPPQPKPLVTMEAFEGGTNHEKGAFIRRHFPDWLAYQKAHGLQKKEMMALTGVAGSVWYNHQLGYRKHPERYGEPKPEPAPEPEPAAVVEEKQAEPILNETEASLRQALTEVQAGEAPSVETLWDGNGWEFESENRRWARRINHHDTYLFLFVEGSEGKYKFSAALNMLNKTQARKVKECSIEAQTDKQALQIADGETINILAEVLSDLQGIQNQLKPHAHREGDSVDADEVAIQLPKSMSTATAVGKIRALHELVQELRAAGAVVQVSVNWTMEL